MLDILSSCRLVSHQLIGPLTPDPSRDRSHGRSTRAAPRGGFAFFITLPYSKFMHGIYRWVALVRYAKERRLILASEAKEAAAQAFDQPHRAG
jgi:hypothetical protein